MSATQPSRSGGPDRGGWYQADLHPDGSAGGNNRSPGSPPLQTCSGGGNLPRAGLERVGRGHHNACGIVGTTDQPDMRWLLTNGRGGPSAQNGGSRVGGPPYPLRQVTGYHDRVVPVLCPRMSTGRTAGIGWAITGIVLSCGALLHGRGSRKGVAKDWWPLFDLVAAWRFVPLDVWLGLGAQQPVKLCIDVQDGVLIIMRAG